MTTKCTNGGCKPNMSQCTPGARFSWLMRGKAPPEMPAFQPYRGKPAVRNDRESRGNDGIIRSPGSRLDSTRLRDAPISRPKRSCVHPPTATHCFWPTRRTRSTPRSHRFGSRPLPNSSPMPKPIRVRSPWRRPSAFVPPSRPPNSRILRSATSSPSRCVPSSARRSKNTVAA